MDNYGGSKLDIYGALYGFISTKEYLVHHLIITLDGKQLQFVVCG